MTPTPTLFYSVYQICVGILLWGGLLFLLFFLTISIARKLRRKPQGRCLYGTVISAISFLIGIGGVVLYLTHIAWFWEIKQPDLANKPGTLTTLGQIAPDFEMTTIDNNRMKLSDLRGKVVVLNFFATWCGPCMKELPYLETDVWQVFKDKPFVMVAIGREETEASLKSFREKHGFTFPMAADPNSTIYGLYAENGIPRTYVISPEGVIVYQVAGFNDEYEPYKSEPDKMIRMIQKQL